MPASRSERLSTAAIAAPPPFHATLDRCFTNSQQVPFKISVSTREQAGQEVQHVVLLQKLTWDEALALKRLSVTVDDAGTILNAVAGSTSLFGFRPAMLVGRSVAQLLDVFEPLKDNRARLTHCLVRIWRFEGALGALFAAAVNTVCCRGLIGH